MTCALSHHRSRCAVHPDLRRGLGMLVPPPVPRWTVRRGRAGAGPLQCLEELAGQWREDSCSRSCWIHVNGAMRACVAAQVLPAPFSWSKQSRKGRYWVCRCPFAGALGDSPDWRGLLSHSSQQKMWVIHNTFLTPCDKKLPWSSHFPCFCALLKLGELPAMSGLDSHRLIRGIFSLTLAVCWAWTAAWS